MTHAETRRLVTKYAAEGLTRKEIAWRMCRTPEGVGRMLKKLKIDHPRANRVHCPELDRLILAGWNNYEIMEVMDVERSFMARRRMALGMPLKGWTRRAA